MTTNSSRTTEIQPDPRLEKRTRRRFSAADVFHGRVAEVAAVRQKALSEHYAQYPQRYVKGPPTVNLPPTAVHINPDRAIQAQQLIDTPGSLRCAPIPVDTSMPEVVT